VFCSNFVKFGQRETGEIVRCLPDKKKFAWLSSSRYCSDRAQNLPGPAPANVLRVLQISSKSVRFRRSYSRTREHRQNVPKVNPIFGWSLASSRIIIWYKYCLSLQVLTSVLRNYILSLRSRHPSTLQTTETSVHLRWMRKAVFVMGILVFI